MVASELGSWLQPEQQEEWEVIQSIYPDYVSAHATKQLIILEIPVHLPLPHRLASSHETICGDDILASASLSPIAVTSLPSVVIGLRVPSTYPSTEPPHIISIVSLHSWLPHDHDLREHLVALWYEGEGVLCSWIEYIESGRFLVEAGLLDSVESVIRLPNLSSDLILCMQEWDSGRMTESFERTSYACTVCLSSVKGSRCILLSCSHVFCRECLEDYWRMLIIEGDVARVGCPDPKCLKMRHKATEDEIQKVVEEAEIERWRQLTNKLAAESDPTMVHCPVPTCQNPVPGSLLDDANASSETLLRVCAECHYSFCSFCLYGWHGPVSDCRTDDVDALVDEYISLDDHSAEKLLIDCRYGRTIQARLTERRGNQVAAIMSLSQPESYLEEYRALHEGIPRQPAPELERTPQEIERANRRVEKIAKLLSMNITPARKGLRHSIWLKMNASKCPGCHVPVTKSHGCDHMTCSRCGTEFCYRCSAKIFPGDSSHAQGCKAPPRPQLS